MDKRGNRLNEMRFGKEPTKTSEKGKKERKKSLLKAGNENTYNHAFTICLHDIVNELAQNRKTREKNSKTANKRQKAEDDQSDT